MNSTKIGGRILQYRKENDLSIKEFSKISGISTALISQLERGIGNPSLSVLKMIAKTLGISLPSLFTEEIGNASLIRRKSEQERIHNPTEKNTVYYNLTPGPLKSNVELLLMKLKPKSETNTGFSRHFEEEIAYIVEGSATMVFEDGEYPLESGDTVRILPSRKHKLRNTGDKPVRVLFIKSKVNY